MKKNNTNFTSDFEMNKFLGYILIAIGFITFVFFLNYKGIAIPLKELWFVLSFFILVFGSYLIVKTKWQSEKFQTTDNEKISQINQLKLTGDRIKVTLNNCEVKTRNFQQEIISESFPRRTEMLDALYDSNRNYQTLEIQQTYIIFYKQYDEKTYKFISQTTRESYDTLKRYMDHQGGIDLYVNKTNPDNYYFDFPFK